MTALVHPSDIEARIRDLLNREIALAARRETFSALLLEIIGRIGDDLEKVQAERLALEDVRIAAVEQKYKEAK